MTGLALALMFVGFSIGFWGAMASSLKMVWSAVPILAAATVIAVLA